MALELIIGSSPDPKAWAEVDAVGKLTFFHEGRARHLVAVGDPRELSTRTAFLVLAVLDEERKQAASFDNCEFVELA